MTDLSILNPVILRTLVQEFTTPENLTWLNRVRRTPVPATAAEWEILRGARNIAVPNVPNSEANVVDRLGRARGAASFAYTREKKVFSPTTLRWIRDFANSNSDLDKTNAERQIRREVQDLSTRLDNYIEFLFWQALKGEFQVVSDQNGVMASVDYGMLPSHKANTSIDWRNAVPKQIVEDVRALINLVKQDGLVDPKEAFTSGSVIDMIVDSFAHHGTSPSAATQPTNFSGAALLSDRMKDEYYATGTITGFMGLNWKVQDAVYDATGSSYTTSPTRPQEETRFLAKNSIVLGNFDNDTLELQEGLSPDEDAPRGFIGRFTKSWTQPDPSGRAVLIEWTGLPILNRPDNLVYVEDVTNPTP
jgi:hypothetical protein